MRLWDGECITGQLLELNKDTLRMRTAWAARLEMPRAAVAAIEPVEQVAMVVAVYMMPGPSIILTVFRSLVARAMMSPVRKRA